MAGHGPGDKDVAGYKIKGVTKVAPFILSFMILDYRTWTAKDLIASRTETERMRKRRCERQVNKDTAREIKTLPVTKKEEPQPVVLLFL